VDDEREERRHTNMEVREWLRGRAICMAPAAKQWMAAWRRSKGNPCVEKLHVKFIFSHSRKLEVENFEYS